MTLRHLLLDDAWTLVERRSDRRLTLEVGGGTGARLVRHAAGLVVPLIVLALCWLDGIHQYSAWELIVGTAPFWIAFRIMERFRLEAWVEGDTAYIKSGTRLFGEDHTVSLRLAAGAQVDVVRGKVRVRNHGEQRVAVSSSLYRVPGGRTVLERLVEFLREHVPSFEGGAPSP